MTVTFLFIRVFFILLCPGVTVHGGPSPERGARKPVWELYRPEGFVVPGVARRDLLSGCQSGVEECQL